MVVLWHHSINWRTHCSTLILGMNLENDSIVSLWHSPNPFSNNDNNAVRLIAFLHILWSTLFKIACNAPITKRLRVSGDQIWKKAILRSTLKMLEVNSSMSASSLNYSPLYTALARDSRVQVALFLCSSVSHNLVFITERGTLVYLQ